MKVINEVCFPDVDVSSSMIKQLSGPTIDINKADVFTMKNEHSYAAFIGVLSNIYMKAHASSNFREGPYCAALVIDSLMIKPYKEQLESSFERLQVIINKMEEPNNGIKLGIFLSDDGAFDESTTVGLKHTVSQCWNMYNDQPDKDIITINLPPSQLKSGNNRVRYFDINKIKKVIDSNKYNLVDYTTPIQQVFGLLEKSKCVICYQGGVAWLSISMGISTIILHPNHQVDDLHLKFKLFGQDLGNINIINKLRQIIHIRKHPCEHHIHIDQLQNRLRELI